jgi:hypothetical protein
MKGFDCTSTKLNVKSIYTKLSLVAIIVTLIISLLFLEATAKSNNPMVFPIDSKPYGLSYDQWAVNWWKWFVSIPASVSPASDPTGANCAQNQNDANVWYLAGTFGGKAEKLAIYDFLIMDTLVLQHKVGNTVIILRTPLGNVSN